MSVREIWTAAALAVAGIALAASGSASGQMQGTPITHQCLAFGEALALATKDNPAVSLAQARQGIAQADARSARSLFKPQLSAFARTGIGDVGLTGGVVQNQAGLRVTQRLFDFGDAKLAREMADLGLAASQYDVAAAQLNAARATGFAYIDAQEAAERLAATEHRLAYFDRELRSIDNLLDRGGATLTDKYEVTTKRANADNLRDSIQSIREKALTLIAIDTGSDADLCDQFGEIRRILEATILGRDLDMLLASAQQNPEIAALESKLDRARAEQRRVRRNRFPIIEAVGISAYSSAGSAADLEQQNRVGLDLSIPLYSGNRLSAANDRAGAQSNAALAEMDKAKRDIERELRVAFAQIAVQREQLSTLSEAADSARKLFSASQTQFDAGLKTLPALIEDRLEYENAQLALIEARYDFLRRMFQLATLAGIVGIHVN